MRITNNLITRGSLHTLQRSLRAVDEAQHRATTGLRVETVSDDPLAASSILGASASLRALEQYQRNINRGNARLAAEEQVLNSLTDTMARARELATQHASSTSNAQWRLAASTEVSQLQQYVIQLGNMRHEGEFLFGGDQSDIAPVTSASPPYLAAPPTGARRAEISSNQYVQTNHNATDVFLNSGVMSALDQLQTALANDDMQGIGTSMTALDAAYNKVQSLIGDVGAFQAQLEVTASNLTAVDVSLRAFRSDLQDADLEKAVTELVGRQTAYQAAMMTTSRVLGLSLANYL
jgi:flagellar hook-associated protein 3 FlgL